MTDLYFKDNTYTLEVDVLTNQVSNSYVNNATVQATIYDIDDVEVPGVSWPVSLSYVAASNGKYQGTVSASLSVSLGQKVKIIYTATVSGIQGQWTEIAQVVRRDG